MTDAQSYGASAVELETLRRLVASHCPEVHFQGFTPSGAVNGEYSFPLPHVDHVDVRAGRADRRGGQRQPDHVDFINRARGVHTDVGRLAW